MVWVGQNLERDIYNHNTNTYTNKLKKNCIYSKIAYNNKRILNNKYFITHETFITWRQTGSQ